MQSREQQHALWRFFSLVIVMLLLLCGVCVLYTRVLILRSRSLAPLTCWTKTAKHLATLSERAHAAFQKEHFPPPPLASNDFRNHANNRLVHYGRNQMKQFLIRRKPAACAGVK
jgi:hypothetical protein